MLDSNFFQKLTIFVIILSPFYSLKSLSAQPIIISQSSTNSEYGIIQGELIYPSDYIPAQKVCAEEIFNKKSYCTETRQQQQSYQLQLPPGVYHVFSIACGETYAENIVCQDEYIEQRAYYNDTVMCGLTYDCEQVTTGNPVPVKVESGKTLSEINPQDWYL